MQNRDSGPCVGVRLGRDLPRAEALRKDRFAKESRADYGATAPPFNALTASAPLFPFGGFAVGLFD